MKIIENKLSETSLEITIDLDRADIEHDLQKTAKHLAEHLSIPGFRPGFAPYDVVCRQVGGEAKIYEEAIDGIVRRTLPKIIVEKKLETFGSPEISVQKMVPPFGLSYKATITLLPLVELGDISKIKVDARQIKIEPKDVEKVVGDLRQMRVSEAAIDRPAAVGDKVTIDFEIKRDSVVIEGGVARDFQLVLGENRFIPGFEDKILGAKAGDKKEFDLSFPKEYFEKSLAGQNAQFCVTIKQVFERILPEFNDEFARGLGGYESADVLRKQIEDNIKKEKEAEEKERFEMACMEELAKLSTISELPEKMMTEETDRMLHELEHSVGNRGLKFEDYLTSIKKTREELANEFKPKAEHRLKISLVARVFGREENIKVEESDVDKEVETSKKIYQQNPEMLKQFASQEYRDYTRNILTSRKIFAALADKIRISR